MGLQHGKGNGIMFAYGKSEKGFKEASSHVL